jgi:hypothetical protein
MDLFFDNQALNTINDLKRALISRNIQIASKKFQALYDIEPHNSIINPAKILLDALVNALEEELVTDPAYEMNYLLNELAPLAHKTLAGQERDYMALFWRRLARYIKDSNYTEESLHEDIHLLHSSVCYAQIPDWLAVIESIEQTPAMYQHQKLLSRYAIALKNSGEEKRYHQIVCLYYWQFKNADKNELINNDPLLKKIWHRYIDLELDKDWGIQNFSCFLLIEQPGIGHYIVPDEQAPKEFKRLQQLIVTEISEQKPSISLRKQLKDIHPDILAQYLKRKVSS